MRSGTLGKDIEDQTRTIQYPAFQELFEVTLLARAEVMVENNQLGFVFLYQRPNFICLAAADIQARA